MSELRLFVPEDDSDDENLQQELSRQEEAIIGSSIKETSTLEAIKGENEDAMQSVDEIREEDEDESPLYPLIPIDEDEGSDLKPKIKDIRPVDIFVSLPLPFQQKVVESCLVSDDPLVIMGKGLGMANVVANLTHVLATPTIIDGQIKRSLVIILNATANDNRQIGEELRELSWLSSNNVDDATGFREQNEDAEDRPFNVVTAESSSVEKRRKLYLSGGTVSVTSRILIVDLLSGILHPNKITGMIVLNVESLRSYSNESFILEIYRSQNKWGFIKGFSESPEPFTMEFSPLMRRMRELRFKNILLWPRFRVEVSNTLNPVAQQSNKVIEVKVSLTDSMAQIQFGLMECLKKCIGELNRKNPGLSLEWWDINNVLDKYFLKSIDSVMMPNWHRISFESKQLVKDIRFLKRLLKLLIKADAVDFYEEIQLSLDANKPSITHKYTESPWLMAEESQLVISHARKRIYYKDEYILEEAPKWEQLVRILDDISHQRLTKGFSGPTCIVCSEKSTAAQLTKIVHSADKKDGFRKNMLKKLKLYKDRREASKQLVKQVKEKDSDSLQRELNVSTTFAKEQPITKRRRTRGAAAVAAVERLRSSGGGEDIESVIDSYNPEQELGRTRNDGYEEDGDSFEEPDDELLITDIIDSQDTELYLEQKYIVEPEEQEYYKTTPSFTSGLTEDIWNERIDNFSYVERNEQVIIETFGNIIDDSFLQETMPSYIIMFEPDLSFIRKVELYRAIQKENPPKIFFMYYGESVEEQGHLLAIKREKDAFTKLIKENAQLASHFEAEEDLSHFKNLAERKMKLNKLRRTNTRNAGGQKGYQHFTQDVVIVDSREFNATLPGLLFRYGVRVIPCMLSVGDYIISPDICIERKSIADLIGSLQNNRLAVQCKKMVQYYKYATLLIEFDENQSFSLEPFSERRNYRKQDISTTHPISSKLSQDEIQRKLSRLVMKFPTLKIIWSSSPLQSVNIILELKLGRDQPDPNLAVSYGTHLRKNFKQKPDNKKKTSNDEAFSTIMNIPGISKIDYFNIRKKIKSYSVLTKMNVMELNDVLGDYETSVKVHDFLRKDEEEEEHDDSD
ncbi:hypothetical protein KAFR_0H01600 [Kazachstania africana CBS 2517]|uniref:ERCC4 domain-containing protein n=1 Tax=Kazachstania africana (strain ATCC 22294 / BCRC 22015 / CBS 2517 / CECT 1963 / NBRC 1671 / NRRL Y-8276) TaxID=1071382 RepID=H2AZ14_KAZAF|nr:hypothetical protein KAFR_0H01600 [Kazachstania africana CBS 2517]CCF59570.1 hypothetical protein KAFR_0H01600 [Kazachstania africana CBS 2517]